MGPRTELTEDRRSGPRRRVLVLFGNIPLLGQERGNIQVFHALRQLGVEALFVTNRQWGGVHIQPFLDFLDLKWVVATYGYRFRKGMSLREWIKVIGIAARDSITLIRLMRRYNPTHIHLSNADHFVHFLPALTVTRIPVIYRVGDAPAVHRKIYRALWAWMIARRVTRFVCVSEYIRSSIVAQGVPESKCTVIYSEAPVRIKAHGQAASKDVKKSRPVTILYVGQLSSHKGVDILVSAAIQMCRSNDNLEFWVAGDYEWENSFAAALKNDIRAADLSDRIQFLGYVESVHELFQRADLHVVPSVLEDPMPNVVIEAKSAGVASIVFPSGGIPEVVEHESEGYVCADKTEASLIAGIEYYATSAERVRVHGANAKASLDRLRITQFAELWNTVYSDV